MTLHSMTGFGSAVGVSKSAVVEVELKSVNHRFLDIVQKLPRSYARYELDLREIVAKALSRGRVELYISRTLLPEALVASTELNKAVFDKLVREYENALKRARVKSISDRTTMVLEILRRSEVMVSASSDTVGRDEKGVLFSAVERAVRSLMGMRKLEGRRLGVDMDKRMRSIESIRKRIKGRAGVLPQQARERLNQRMKQYASDIQVDSARLAQELCLYADKLDITEELVRIESHLGLWQRAVKSEPMGRRFEFIVQELGREFNTIGNKAQDGKVQAWVIDAKLELEKIREQIQNVE